MSIHLLHEALDKPDGCFGLGDPGRRADAAPAVYHQLCRVRLGDLIGRGVQIRLFK